MYAVDPGNAVEWSHPDNAGLTLLLLGLPGAAGGSRWPDLAGRTAGGTLAGSPAWGPRPAGDAALTTASGRYADLGTAATALSPAGPFTLAAWFRTTATGQQEILASYSMNPNPAGVILGVSVGGNAAGRLGLLSGRNAAVLGAGYQLCNGATAVSDGAWHRGVGTWDGATLSVYVDGRLDAAVAWAFAPTYAAPYHRVGAGQSTGSTLFGYFSGGLAAVGLWARAADAGWAARDYQWSRDWPTDPRLRVRSFRPPTYPADSALAYAYPLTGRGDPPVGAGAWVLTGRS